MERISFEDLKAIGIQQISEKTKITQTKIKQIFNKEFENLERVSTTGFIKLIEKEFNANLSDWLDEYNRFLESKKEKIEEKPLFTWNTKKSSPLKRILLTLILLIIIIATIFVYLKSTNQTLESLKERIFKLIQEESQTLKQNQIQPETNETKVTSESIKIEYEATVENNTSQIVEENISANIETQINNQEQNITTQLPSQHQKSQKMVIIPKHKVWLGVINLDTGNRINRFIESEFVLDRKKRLLVVLGKGDINISIDNVTKEYNSQNPLRFYVDEDEFRQIDSNEFMTLNGGKIW